MRADPDCVAGLIIGTGTNICYVEKGENVTKLGTLRESQCTRARARSLALALARTHSTHSMHRNPPAPPRPDPCVLGYPSAQAPATSAQDSPGFAPVCPSADRAGTVGRPWG